MSEVWFALWFFLPAGISNATPVLANTIPGLKAWKTPMDFGKSYKGKRLLGTNKTWRGFVTGVLAASLTSLMTYVLFPASVITIFGYVNNPLIYMSLLGLLLGSGALLGDAVESFFKRRSGVPAGHSWFPFDQTDYIIGGLLFVSPLVSFSWQTYLIIGITWFVMHLSFAYLGYLLKLKDKPI